MEKDARIVERFSQSPSQTADEEQVKSNPPSTAEADFGGQGKASADADVMADRKV